MFTEVSMPTSLYQPVLSQNTNLYRQQCNTPLSFSWQMYMNKINSQIIIKLNINIASVLYPLLSD